jgi:hypothetical protein
MKSGAASWVSPKVEVRSVGGKGIGSFAKQPIAAGEIVVMQGGRIIGSTTLTTGSYKPFAYHCFQVDKGLYICPLEPTQEALDGILQVNHSCEPTCGIRGQIALVAMRDIKAGEEITYDYAMTDVADGDPEWEPMACSCGARNCRKTITGSDWKLPDLQEKYKGYFSDYLQRLIR